MNNPGFTDADMTGALQYALKQQNVECAEPSTAEAFEQTFTAYNTIRNTSQIYVSNLLVDMQDFLKTDVIFKASDETREESIYDGYDEWIFCISF